MDINFIHKPNVFAYGSLGVKPLHIVTIEANEIKLHQKGIDITMDVSNETLSLLDEIVINGFKFERG